MNLNLVSLPAVFMVIPEQYTLLQQVPIRAHWQLKACSRACLNVCMIAWLIACLRKLYFELSRVLRRKLLADGKL